MGALIAGTFRVFRKPAATHAPHAPAGRRSPSDTKPITPCTLMQVAGRGGPWGGLAAARNDPDFEGPPRPNDAPSGGGYTKDG